MVYASKINQTKIYTDLALFFLWNLISLIPVGIVTQAPSYALKMCEIHSENKALVNMTPETAYVTADHTYTVTCRFTLKLGHQIRNN